MKVISSSVGAGLAMWMLAATAPALVPDPVFTNYYWGLPLQLPQQPRELAFKPDAKQAGFTAFEGVTNVAVQDRKLVFTLITNRAVLGWGNYLGKQAVADRVDAWEQFNDIILKVRQSGASSVWHVIYWADGKRMQVDAGNYPMTIALTNSGPRELKFYQYNNPQCPVMDGFEVQVTGTAGDRCEIESVRLVRPLNEGYVRTEITLPEGKIWRAVADVGYANEESQIKSELYINGQLVKRRGTRWLYGAAPVDIAAYLKPGKNGIAFHGWRLNYSPFVYFQSRIVMASGAIVTVQTDKKSWKYSPKEEPGWNQPGFNDAAWKPALEGGFYGGANPEAGMDIPAHQGCLLLRNPYNKDLIYLETNAVVIEVAVPAGLKDKVTALEYLFATTDKEGKSIPVKEGRLTDSKNEGDSLVYRIDVGKQPRGVYTIELRLQGKEGAIEGHPREPVMVLRQFQGKPINSRDYFEGLDVELEDTIDFTNPQDPHPWYEVTKEGGKLPGQVQPRIVQTNGLVYRQVIWDEPRKTGAFSYRMNNFKHPGDFYVLELEYPDDAWRITQAAISPRHEGFMTTLSGVGMETGGRFYLTGKMQKLRWICVGQAGIHSVDIQSVMVNPNGPAAARGLKVYHVKGDLPQSPSGTGREFGIQTERSYVGSGVAHNFGDNPELVALQRLNAWNCKPEERVPMLVKSIRWLRWLQDAHERYAQYCKFAGQNKHIMGCIQYTDQNTPFLHPWEYPTARINGDFREVLANVLNANGIDVYAGVELCQFPKLGTYASNWQVAHRGANSAWLINGKGEQHAGIIDTWKVMNFFHPQFDQTYRELMAELAEKFGHLPHFKGVWSPLFTANPEPCCFIPCFGSLDNPFAYSYDDFTFDAFAKDTGIDLTIPKNDPARFEKRALAVRNPSVQKKFAAWRAQRMHQFLVGALATLRAQRPDLRLLTAVFAEREEYFKAWQASNKPYREFLRDFGMDLDLAVKTEGLAMGRWTIGWREDKQSSPQNPYVWQARVNPEFTSAYDDRPTDRYVFVRSSWKESGISFCKGDYYKPKVVESDWIYDVYQLRTLPQPAHVHCREALIEALITGDPDTLTYGFTDLNINVGNEQELREFARVFTCLPKERFAPVLDTGLETELAIRRLVKDGKTYLYAANPGYWRIKGALTLQGKGEVRDLVTGQPVKTAARGEARQLSVDLAPFMLAAWAADEPKLEVTAYATEDIAAEEQAYLKQIIARVSSLVADPDARLALAPRDRDFIDQNLRAAEKALAARRYARAWAVLTDTKFWLLWKDFLEKAAQGMARLPATFKKQDEDQRLLVAAAAAAPITLDGKLDEADWQRSPLTGGFVTGNNLPAIAETAVQALYDDKHLYLGFVCADRDVKALKATGQDPAQFWGNNDDVLVMFLQPNEKEPVYYQLGFNPKGLHFNQRKDLPREITDYSVRPAWQSATATGAGYWTAEVVVPCEELGVARMTDNVWRVNFHRVMRNNMLDPVSWSFSGRTWHAPDQFGRLVLVASQR